MGAPATTEPVPAPTRSASAPTTLGPALADVSDRLRAALVRLNAVVTPSTGATAPSPAPAPAPSGFVVPGRGVAGGAVLDAAPGGGAGLQTTDPADRPLVDTMLAHLRTSATGSQLLAGIERIGAKVTVLDGAQFEAAGHEESGAYYDPLTDTMFLRRSDLQSEPRRTAATFAHEAAHALDDAGKVGDAYVAQQTARHTVAGTLTPAAVEQIRVERSLAKEARAFTIQTSVLRELAVPPTGALADIVRTGANDQATYRQIFTMLSDAGRAGGYNSTGAPVAPFDL